MLKMNLKNLFKVFNRIDAPNKRGLFFIEGKIDNFFLTKTKRKNPAFGFSFDKEQVHTPNSNFEGIEIQFYPFGEIVHNKIKNQCTFIICENLRKENLERFYDLILEIYTKKEQDKACLYSIGEIMTYLISWAKLFRKDTGLKNQDTLGLFGELVFLLKSGKPNKVQKFWRSPDNSKFDFIRGNNLLDVKTSSLGLEHSFELEQVSESKNSKKFIASICVEESMSKGKSIYDIENILKKKIKEKNFLDKLKKRKKNLKLNQKKYLVTRINIFDSKDIPQPENKSDYVYEVRFRSNLSHIKQKKPFKEIINKFCEN
jgi:hypothetical protein